MELQREHLHQRNHYAQHGRGRESLNLLEVIARDDETSGALFVLQQLLVEVQERAADEEEKEALAAALAGDEVSYGRALVRHSIKRGHGTLALLRRFMEQLKAYEAMTEAKNPLYAPEHTECFPHDCEPYPVNEER